MSLYRIILVDDEEEVRTSYARLTGITWGLRWSEMQRTEQRHWKRLNSWSRR